MREHKYRGKRIDNGEWVYGNYFYWIKRGVTHHIIGTGVQNGSVMGFEVDPETVGQFTGLKDKDGKEIYEGDILHYPDGFQSEIIFDKGVYLLAYAKCPLSEYSFDMEVIGSIHH